MFHDFADEVEHWNIRWLREYSWGVLVLAHSDTPPSCIPDTRKNSSFNFNLRSTMGNERLSNLSFMHTYTQTCARLLMTLLTEGIDKSLVDVRMVTLLYTLLNFNAEKDNKIHVWQRLFLFFTCIRWKVKAPIPSVWMPHFHTGIRMLICSMILRMRLSIEISGGFGNTAGESSC
jgi:hypothetical protein